MKRFIYIKILLIWGSFSIIGGCVSQEQHDTLNKWAEMNELFHSHDYILMEQPRSAFILQKLGKPDYIAKGDELDKLIPEEAIRNTIIDLTACTIAGDGYEIPRPEIQNSLKDATFWFYDEDARYVFPSCPTWGMGCGFETFFFVFNGEDALIASGSISSWNNPSPLQPGKPNKPLSQTKPVPPRAPFAVYTPEDRVITLGQACEIAKTQAGNVEVQELQIVRSKYDKYHNRYIIIFEANAQKEIASLIKRPRTYRYEVDAKTGKIIWSKLCN